MTGTPHAATASERPRRDVRLTMESCSLVRYVALAGALAFIAMPAAARGQGNMPVEVQNRTRQPVRLTVYWGYQRGGRAENGEFHDHFKPVCLEAGTNWNGTIPFSAPELGPVVHAKADVYRQRCLVAGFYVARGGEIRVGQRWSSGCRLALRRTAPAEEPSEAFRCGTVALEASAALSWCDAPLAKLADAGNLKFPSGNGVPVRSRRGASQADRHTPVGYLAMWGQCARTPPYWPTSRHISAQRGGVASS
jgi:hypothetical protein